MWYLLVTLEKVLESCGIYQYFLKNPKKFLESRKQMSWKIRRAVLESPGFLINFFLWQPCYLSFLVYLSVVHCLCISMYYFKYATTFSEVYFLIFLFSLHFYRLSQEICSSNYFLVFPTKCSEIFFWIFDEISQKIKKIKVPEIQVFRWR